MYDLIIIGAGPAGLTAAVYAARKKLNTLLISTDLGGQPNQTSGIENYMGYQYIEGPELVSKFEEQVKQFPIDIKIGPSIVSLAQVGREFEIKSAQGDSYQAKAMIIASGKRPRPLNVPGEDRLRARGVTYCAICDGPIFQGQKVVVVGGGNSALEAVYDLVKICEHVYVVQFLPSFTGDQVLIDSIKSAPNLTIFLSSQVMEIEGTSRVEAIKIKERETGEITRLEVGGVFVEIGLIPNSEFAKGLAPLNAAGEIEVNCACDTGIPGLFAAGDVTNVVEKQIVVAAGEGAKAALQAHKYLQRLQGQGEK